MFTWLKKLLSINNNIHLHVHVDGKILVYNDRQGLSKVDGEGPRNDSATKTVAEDAKGTNKDIEIGIDPSLFADTQETKVSFGNEFEPTSEGSKDEDK